MNNLISVFNKAIEYIEEKIKNSEEMTNKDIAEKYLYNADRFTKAFKDTFGITPSQLKRKEKTETLIDNFMNPMFIENYSQYIKEPRDSIIKEIEEMKFIGISDLDLLSENIQTIENDFEDMAIINENGKMFELSYFIDDEKNIKIHFMGIIIARLDITLKLLK